MLLNEFLLKFKNVKQVSPTEYEALCPAHGDKHPSLHISEGEDGKILINCKAGCTAEEIVAALDLEMSDLFPASENTKTEKAVASREHIYVDKNFSPVAKKTIYRNSDGSKSCCWHLFENGEWVLGLSGYKVSLYNLGKLAVTEDKVIYIVEGEKDADTLINMGYVATTCPHGAESQWILSEYNKYFEGKDVIIIADNDDVGKEYARNIAMGVSIDANSVKVIPAENIYPKLDYKGDFSDIVSILGEEEAKRRLAVEVEKTDFFIQPKAKITSELPIYIENTKAGLKVNTALLARTFKENEEYKLVRDENTGCSYFCFYENGKYVRTSDESVKAKIKGYITTFQESLLKMYMVKETLENLKADNDYVSPLDFDNNEKIINFTNGMLNIFTMELLPHSTKYLSMIQLPIEWSCEQEDTPVFDKYMNDLTEGDERKINLLLQIIGLCISNVKGYRFKKALFLVGKGDTGKTQIRNLAEKLIGKENCCSVDLSDLESRFGLSSLYGKRLSGSADMGNLSISQLKTFKMLTGGDPVEFEQKHRDKFSAYYNGFLWFCANHMPLFGGDRGDWVYDRIIIITCKNRIPEEDRDSFICDKMFAERTGIVKRAIKALKAAIDNGYKFDIPDDCKSTLSTYKKDNSPAISFFVDCCELRTNDISQGDNCTATTIRKVFNEWCKDTLKGFSLSAKNFETEIAEYLGKEADDIKVRKSFGRYYCFKLTNTAKEEYRRVYGCDTL